MSFEPLGYRFEVTSLLSPEQAKAALRAKKKAWSDPKNGPRGWIVGPYFCFWLSLWDSQGPMVFGTITSENLGSKIVGRAGSDLNGMLALLLFVPALFAFMLLSSMTGQGSIGQILLFLVFFGLGLPLALWLNHKDRKRAAPLVRFIERALAPENSIPSEPRRTPRRSEVPVQGAEMTIDGMEAPEAPSPATIAEAVKGLKDGGFVIIAFEPQHYMQTAKKDDRFVLEKRSGSPAAHYHVGVALEGGQVIEAFCAYLKDPRSDCGFSWEPGPGN